MKKEDFNGYAFNDPKTRKHMKYLVVTDGDLDLNGVYAFMSKKAALEHFKTYYRSPIALFKIEDITP